MADLPISLLPTAEGLDPADLIPIVNNGVTKKIAVRTIGGTPLELGPTLSVSSVPVTIATDQAAIPVKEVNKEITQVSLSLLGIPRSEVALGIFGDVNTYDVNPLEWTSFPSVTGSLADTFGIKHLSAESSAQISCPPGLKDATNNILNFSRLTSKRFFRYQPGRVSAGTFGLRADTYNRSNRTNGGLSELYVVNDSDGDPALYNAVYNKNATVKKFGMFDNENGYYFEIRGDGTKDSFLVVRRTGSVNVNTIPDDLASGSYPLNTDPNIYGGLAGVHGIIVRDKLILEHAAYYDTTLRADANDIASGNYVTITNYPNEVPGAAPGIMLDFYTYHRKNFRWETFLPDLSRDFTTTVPLRVKREYAYIYEYRVPRSNFNYDCGNGEVNLARWSDAMGDYVAGDLVTEDDVQVYTSSVKNIDFTKVTMYKIEYSWYGAVGAQFLAYVPVNNNLARWVRLHHMRVSNQLTTPSLGNPFLPFTYLNVAGASTVKTGTLVQRLYKYGASYLIDGGDKGTVKINTVNTDIDKAIYPDRQVLTVNALSANRLTGTDTNLLSANLGTFTSYHIGSKLYGPGVSSNIFISDISNDGSYAFIKDNRPLGVGTAAVSLTAVSTRGTPIVGVQVKDYINNIRNRSQIYPVRLSFGCDKRTIVQLVKNPLFPSLSGTTTSFYNTRQVLSAGGTDNVGGFIIPAGTQEISFTSRSQFIPFITGNIGRTVIGSFYGIRGVLKLANYNPSSIGTYTFRRLAPGDEFNVAAAAVVDFPALGRGAFTPELPLRGDGVTLFNPITSSWTSDFYLAAVNEESAETRTAIPGIGDVLATFNVGAGGVDIDLSPYFGYDKQYLSYPLVESGSPDILYVVAKTADNVPGSGGGSLTWEEQ